MIIENVLNIENSFDVRIIKVRNCLYKVSIIFDILGKNSSFVFPFINEIDCLPDTTTNTIISKKDHKQKEQRMFVYLNKLLLMNIVDYYTIHENSGQNKTFMVSTDLGILTIEYNNNRMLMMINSFSHDSSRYTALFPSEYESKMLHRQLVEALDLI